MKVEDIINLMYVQANTIGQCGAFKGTESLEEICALLKSPQGVEFCLGNHFPNMATLRLFKTYKPEQYGVYVDAGAITLTNPTSVVLAGRTTANIICDSVDARHQIVVMHGAKAVVNASKWAVCAVKIEQGCSVIKNTSDHAIIL